MSDHNSIRARILSKVNELGAWKPVEPTRAESKQLEIIRGALENIEPAGTERDVVRVLTDALECPGGMANRIVDTDRGDLRLAPWNLPEWFVKRILSWQGETDPTPELIQKLPRGTSFHILDVISMEELMDLPVARRLYSNEFDPWLELVVQHEDCRGCRTTRTLTFFYAFGAAKTEQIARHKRLLYWIHKDIAFALEGVGWPLLDSSGPEGRNDPIGVDTEGRIAVASAEGLRSLSRWMPVSERASGETWAKSPGQPLIVAGERVSPEVMETLQVYREGRRKHSMVIRIAGASDPTLATPRVLPEMK